MRKNSSSRVISTTAQQHRTASVGDGSGQSRYLDGDHFLYEAVLGTPH